MKVLVVEDAPEVVETVKLCVGMRWPDSAVIATDCGDDAAPLMESEAADIVLLDLALNGMDGLSVLQELRKFSDVPVIILSGRGDDVSRIKGLEMGADDYIVKPFSHTELLARMKAILRRTSQSELWGDEGIITGRNLSIDLARRRVRVGDRDVDLSQSEWNLLAFMARNERKIFSNRALAEKVWGSDFVESSAIKMCVRRLRLKLGDDPRNAQLIKSYRGAGYSFEMPR